MQEKKGYVSFVLHAHLPFIHHPESNDYLEESWLYEAISETYIPLLTYFKKLVDEGVNFRITIWSWFLSSIRCLGTNCVQLTIDDSEC